MTELSKEKLETLYELIEVAKATGKLKKGTNEATKAIEKGTAKVVAYAADINPPEVTMHIPLLAKEKGIACFAVPKRDELGTAAGLLVPTAAVAVVDAGNGKKLLAELLKDGKKESKADVEKTEAAPEEEKKEAAPAQEASKEAEAKPDADSSSDTEKAEEADEKKE